MKKEEILEASKKENKNKDVYKTEVQAKASNIACASMLILAFIYFVYEIMKGNGIDSAFYSIITLYNAILYSYMAIKIEKYRKLNAFTGIIWGILTIILVLNYFKVI